MRAKMMQEQLTDLKKFAFKGMKSIISTISAIDDNSKKIVYKHFDQSHVNILAKEGPNIVKNLNEIKETAENE
jgi:hypothetical protein